MITATSFPFRFATWPDARRRSIAEDSSRSGRATRALRRGTFRSCRRRQSDTQASFPFHELSALREDHRIRTREDGAVGVGVSEELFLLTSRGEEIRPPTVNRSELPVPLDPLASALKGYRTEPIESHAWGILDRYKYKLIPNGLLRSGNVPGILPGRPLRDRLLSVVASPSLSPTCLESGKASPKYSNAFCFSPNSA